MKAISLEHQREISGGHMFNANIGKNLRSCPPLLSYCGLDWRFRKITHRHVAGLYCSVRGIATYYCFAKP